MWLYLINARVPQAIPGPGRFFGQIVIESDDPAATATRVAASMQVNPAPELDFYHQVLDDDAVPPSSGDGDGYAEPGETVEIWVDLVNQGWLTAQGVTGSFWLGGPATSFSLTNLNLTWPNLAPGETRRSNAALRLTIEPSCPDGTQVVIHGSVNDSAPEYGPWQVRLTTITIQRVSTIRGRATDENTGRPLAGVTVAAEGLVRISMNSAALKAQAETQPTVLGVEPAPWVVDEAKEADFAPSAGVLGSGGPDGFGYVWEDSDEPGGPAYSWVDITGTGTVLPLSGDDVFGGPYPMGITFPFYGGTYTHIKVSTNGWITFGDHSSSDHSNDPLPSSTGPPLLIAVLWDDLVCPSGSIYTWSDGTTFIISFINVRRYGTSDYYTFQIILNKNGGILLQYGAMTTPNNSCTIGIQNADKTIGLQVVFDAPYLKSNLAVRISRAERVYKTAVTGPDGTYAIHGLPGTTHTVTASKSGYPATLPARYTRSVPPNQSGLDFRMLSPLSQITPTSFTFVLDPDQTAQQILTIGNNGSDVLQWSLLEEAVSGVSRLGAVGNRNAAQLRVLADAPRGPVNAAAGLTLQPAARIEGALSYVLVYTDDPVHTSPGNYVDQALQTLGIPYTAYYNGAFGPFETALNTGGPWRLVIFNNKSNSTPQSSLNALNQYVANGGKLIAACWSLASFSSHPLWLRMGIAHVANDSDPPDPVYWWQPAHPIFNTPRSVREFTNLTGSRYSINGQHLSVLAGAEALAGYTSGGPQPNKAALVLANNRHTLFRGFTDGINDADRDSDGIRDGVELWINTINYILDPIPWLTESPLSGTVQPRSITGTSGVVLTADTTGMAVGTYRGQLRLQTNDFRAPATTIPVTLVIPDRTAPTTPGTPVPDKAPLTSRTTVVYTWTPAQDPDSGISNYQCQVGTWRGGADIFNGSVGNVLQATITGANGQTLYCRVRALNGTGLTGPWSPWSVATRIDALAPTVTPPRDTGYATSHTSVAFSWTAAVDPGCTPSGIRAYHLRVGPRIGMSNYFNAVVGNVLSRNVTASNGQRLYAQIRAWDNAGNLSAWSAGSDGILVDTVAPGAPGRPTDPGAFTSSTSVQFRWTAASDPGTTPSGIASYELRVGTTVGGTNVFNGIVGNVLTRTVTAAGGQTLYARVRARDRAGNVGPWSADPDGITVDLTRPRLTHAVSRDAYAVTVTFGEPVIGADVPANYSVVPALQIFQAKRLSDSQYLLHTSAQTAGTVYTITADYAIRDRAGNAMDPGARSRTFTGPARTSARSWERYR